MGSIKMLIVDDHIMVRDGLSSMLGRQQDFAVIGEAGNGREAVEKVQDLSLDVMLMDPRMPEMSGVEHNVFDAKDCDFAFIEIEVR